MTRIGVVADTHCPEFLDELPAALFEALKGVDLILHAGDVGGPETLDRLGSIAPVQAVRGDHDQNLPDLPRTLELEIDGRRIAVVHGNRSRVLEEPITFLGTVTLGYYWPTPGLHSWLARRFPAADVVIYGHTHAAAVKPWQSTLLFNPGAVYQVDRPAAMRRLDREPNWFEWSWLQVVRHRRRVPKPSVGILELTRAGISATIVPL